jgi:hypothetical protein
MTLDAFWQLIDDSRRESAKLVDLPSTLIDVLSKQDDQEIVDFELHYVDCLHRAYDAYLWLAAVVIIGGCGDDTFSDFRGWLIAQGRQRFESALADPDSLADLESFDGDDGFPLLFYFGSVAPHAFSKQTTGDNNDNNAVMLFHALCSIPAYPPLKRRELIDASEEQARAMFPRLTARFGQGMRAERYR